MNQALENTHDVAEWQSLIERGNEAYASKGYTEAELKFAAALRIAEKWSSAEALAGLSKEQQDVIAERLAKSLNNMAALYHTQGKYKMAEDLYDRCLDVKIKLYGEDDLEVALNLHNLALVHCAKARWNMAEPLLTRAIEIREKLLGESHPDLAPILFNYALMLRRMKRMEEATQVEQRAKALSSTSSSENTAE